MMGMRDPEEERQEQEAKAAAEHRKKAKRAHMADIGWTDFFQYFMFAEVHWIGQQFYEKSDGYDTMTREDIFEITQTWFEYRWGGIGRSLDTMQVQPVLAEEAAKKCGLDLEAASFTFRQTILFIFHYQHAHLMMEKTSGFTIMDLDTYKHAFEMHCYGRQGAKAQELWSIFKDLGFIFPSLEEQKHIIDLIKESDCDKNGIIDFEELLNLLRTVIDENKVVSRIREHTLIVKSGMALEECDQWIDVFLACVEDTGTIRVHDVKKLLNALDLKWGQDGTKQLSDWLRAVDEDSNGEIDFGEFCCLIQKMWDSDFGGIRGKSSEAMRLIEDTAKAEKEAAQKEAEEEGKAVPLTVNTNTKRQSSRWIDHISEEVEQTLEPGSPNSLALINKMEEKRKQPVSYG